MFRHSKLNIKVLALHAIEEKSFVLKSIYYIKLCDKIIYVMGIIKVFFICLIFLSNQQFTVMPVKRKKFTTREHQSASYQVDDLANSSRNQTNPIQKVFNL